jgi:hypothetical protein
MMFIPATNVHAVLIGGVNASIEGKKPKETATKNASSKQGKSAPLVPRTID